MIGFGIDQIQAEYVAEIKLRNINREYILKRTAETADLEREIAELEKTLGSRSLVQKIIIRELEQVSKKYAQPRKTTLVTEEALPLEEAEEELPDYPVTVFVSKEGYFKKITPQSLRMSGEQKFKEGDSLKFSQEAANRSELLVFTDRYQVYKARCSDFDDGKSSLLGDYLPTKLGFEPGETVVDVCLPGDYSGFMLFFFENGKVARVAMSAYDTKSNRKKLTGAYSDKSPLKSVLALQEEKEIVVYSSDGRALVFSTAQLTPKTTRSTQGVGVLTLRKNATLFYGAPLENTAIVNRSRYRAKSLPAAGAVLKPEDMEEKQVALDL